MIDLDGVTFTFRGADRPAIDGLTANVERGQFVLVCGRSGCGKSTLLKLINGIAPGHDEGDLAGTVTVGGLRPRDVTIQELSATVGSVFQHPRSQLFSISTTDELLFGCGNHRVERSDMLDRMEETVAAFGIEDLLDRSIFELSGGEAQKIACASTHMNRPEFYVFDEPSANLDDDAIEGFTAVLTALKRSGATILVAEHRLHYLMDLCDRVLYLEDGRLVGDWGRQDFQDLGEDHRSTMGLRAIRVTPRPGPAGDAKDGEAPAHRPLETASAGADDRHRRAGSAASTVMIERLRCRRKRNLVVDIDGLELPKHQVIALTGPNGAGKSTFVAGFTGIIRSDGIVRDERVLSRRQRMRRSFVVFQDVHHQLFAESVIDEVLLDHDLEDETKLVEAMDTIDALGLGHHRDSHPSRLSGGEKQRTAIAAALTAETRYLVFDEPTSGVDRDHMNRFANQVQEMKTAVDLVLVVTHDTEFITACADRVVELAGGKVVGEDQLR
ncbi:MAG: ABC transporter ATP-binding protein [Actinomycetota bacterium]